jgi:hypothetical protein
MYDIANVISNIDARPTAISLAGLMAMLVGYIQCIESIRLGFRDKTHAMPIAATTFFFAHDTFFAGSYFSGHGVSNHWFFAAGGYIIAPYIILEFILTWQIIKYSGKELGLGATIGKATASYVGIQFAMYVFFLFMRASINDPLYLTTTYISLFVGTVWMIPLLLTRKSRKGQSLLLALTLWIGQTLSIVIYYPMLSDYFVSPIIIAVGVTHFIIGGIYTYMLSKAPRYEVSSG